MVFLALSGGFAPLDGGSDANATSKPQDVLGLGDAVSAAHANRSRLSARRQVGDGSEDGRAAEPGFQGADDGLVRIGPRGVNQWGSAPVSGAPPSGGPVGGGGVGDQPQLPRLPVGNGGDGIGGVGAPPAISGVVGGTVEDVTTVVDGVVDGVAPVAAPVTEAGGLVK